MQPRRGRLRSTPIGGPTGQATALTARSTTSTYSGRVADHTEQRQVISRNTLTYHINKLFNP
eukprot:3291338-Heterocapsa_arctica.AAC.1